MTLHIPQYMYTKFEVRINMIHTHAKTLSAFQIIFTSILLHIF